MSANKKRGSISSAHAARRSSHNTVAASVVRASFRKEGDTIARCIDALEEQLRHLFAVEDRFAFRMRHVNKAYEASCRNLLHYIAFRAGNIPAIGEELSRLGLSSLGRSESHVVSSMIAVLKVLYALAGRPWRFDGFAKRQVLHREGEALLNLHTEALLGPPRSERRTRIMVTLPREAADDPHMVRSLVENGMDCARINCAHDDREIWGRMVDNVRAAAREQGRTCAILMDLAGPKLRTGPLRPGPQVVKVRPRRDALGKVQHPAVVALAETADPAVWPDVAVILPLPASFLKTLRKRDVVQFVDARGKRRSLHIVENRSTGCLAHLFQTAYIQAGAQVRVMRKGTATGLLAVIGALPPVENPIVLRAGDRLVITARMEHGRPAVLDSKNRVRSPARISCTIPSVVADVRAGERIWLDDGKIAGVIERTDGKEMVVRITSARRLGSKLRADKGINLPDSDLRINGLTEKDIEDLAFIAAKADMVALSFVRSASDIRQLRYHTNRLGCRNLGIVLKIETAQAIRRLRSIMLASMGFYPIGVMIARGDLAVEVGFSRLAEVQQEILWFCEAAHIPVIWATQVLENLAKQGQPSRAEITDAAAGVRAECVMLNKGPFIVNALRLLDTILRRMERQEDKRNDFFYSVDPKDELGEDASYGEEK